MIFHILLKSSPEEDYIVHINEAIAKFEIVYKIFKKTVHRIFNLNDTPCKDLFKQMVLFHDLGKLTQKWQDSLRTNKSCHPTLQLVLDFYTRNLQMKMLTRI
jgi:CRISPR/Cas system-associated endonuclease Cas3-HD